MTWCIDPRVSSLFFHFSSFFTLLRELSGRAVFHSLVRFRSVRSSVQQCCWVLPIDDDSLPLFRRDPYFINYHHLRALDVFACYSLRWSHELEIFSIFFYERFPALWCLGVIETNDPSMEVPQQCSSGRIINQFVSTLSFRDLRISSLPSSPPPPRRDLLS